MKPFLVIIFVLVGIVWGTKFVQLINYISGDNIRFATFLKMTLFVLPKMIIIILPLTLSFSSSLIYNSFIESKELIVLKNFGLKKIELLLPNLFLSILITIFSYFLVFYFVPASYSVYNQVKKEANTMSINLIKENSFSSFGNFTTYSNKKDNNNVIYNFFVYDNESQQKKENTFSTLLKNKKQSKENKKKLILQAEKAEFNKDYVLLYNGVIQELEDNKVMNILFFDKLNKNYTSLIVNDNKSNKNLKSMSISNLFSLLKFHLNQNSKSSKEFNRIIYEINYRFSFPLTCIIITLLSSSIVLSKSFNRMHTNRAMYEACFFSLIAYLILLFFFQKIKDNLLFIYITYILMISMVGYSICLIRENNNV